MTALRRKEKEITERAVIEEILMDQEVGRLATCVDGVPYVVPINYAYSKGVILIHSFGEGKKMENLRRNPRVCFEVDTSQKIEKEKPCDYTYEYMSVVADGEARIIDDPEESLQALRRIVDKYAPGKGKSVSAEDLAKYPKLTLVEIRVTQMAGKRSPVR